MARTPTRFFDGVTTVRGHNPLGMFGMPDPTRWHVFWEDWDYHVAASWTVTKTGAGTNALTDENGGVLLLTNAAADNDAVYYNKVGEGFLMASGKKAFFKARFKVSDATQSDFVMGLQITDTTPLDATDGIYFMKDDGDTQLDVYVRKDATTGSTSATNIATVGTSYFTVAWAYDGKSAVKYFVDDVHLGTLDGSSSFLPDTELTVSFGVQNGEAVAKTMSVDYIFAALER